MDHHPEDEAESVEAEKQSDGAVSLEELLEELEVGEAVGAGTVPLTGSGLVRTFFVFTELPKHIEWRVADMPILSSGLVIDLDMALKNPKFPSRTRRVRGPYWVSKVKLVYATSRPGLMGLSQYLEVSPVP